MKPLRESQKELDSSTKLPLHGLVKQLRKSMAGSMTGSMIGSTELPLRGPMIGSTELQLRGLLLILSSLDFAKGQLIPVQIPLIDFWSHTH